MRILGLFVILFSLGWTDFALSSNLTVSNVALRNRNTTAGPNNSSNFAFIQSTLRWENSWRITTGPANYDAVWVFAKYRVGAEDPVLVGANSSGTTVTVPTTASLRVGMPVVLTGGSGVLDVNTRISAVLGPTSFTITKTPLTTLNKATMVARRIWEPARLSAVSAQHTAVTGSVITAVPNGAGVFVYRSGIGSGTLVLDSLRFRWNYGLNEVQDRDLVEVRVFGIEMVAVPTGSFALGSGGTMSGEFYAAPTLNPRTPYTVTSENAILVDSLTTGALYYQTSSANEGDRQGPLPAAFPKGYQGFYMMKYEASQGQYRDFLNTLPYLQQNFRTGRSPQSPVNSPAMVTGNLNRNGLDIQVSGNAALALPAVYACNLNKASPYNHTDDGEWIACNWLSWMDNCAYLDWAGLRPMTELEYEKACRGPVTPVSGEYAWGNTNLVFVTGLRYEGTNEEKSFPPSHGANITYHNQGSVRFPTRVGMFADATSNRQAAGASYWGIMELSGNLWEPVVTAGNSQGRAFTGIHGDGFLASGGSANSDSWPGRIDNVVVGSDGMGLRGSAWDGGGSTAAVSDRSSAARSLAGRDATLGCRGVRTMP
jgi:formylglycine-generating enzyme required for sulfatase activity